MSNVFSNLGLKIFSFVVALGLWFFVLSSNNIEITKEVELELLLPPDTVVANEITDKVTFRLAGSKFFLRTVMNSIDKIKIDLSDAKPGPTYQNITSDMLRLPIGVKVTSISPSRIYPVIEPLRSKNVPIQVKALNEPPQGIRLIRLEAVPKNARIKGPKSKIDKINVLKPEPVDISEARSELKWQVPIDIGIPGVSFDEETAPVISVEVEPLGSNFRVAGVPLKIIASRKYTADVDKVALYVRCPPDLLKTLTPNRVEATITVKHERAGQYVRRVDVKLPAGVKLVRVVPEEVKIQLD